jgi:hypothetical protein
MSTKKVLALVVLVSTVILQMPTFACGPFFDEVDFSYTLHPDIPFSKFAGGNIGILKSTMARSYLVIAWRYLNGTPLSAAEKKAAVDLWELRLGGLDGNDSKDMSQEWVEQSKKFGAAAANNSIYPNKSFNGKEAFFSYLNCPDDAFTTAIKTAQQLSSQFGVSSPEFKDWLNAQNKVFCNCSGGSPVDQSMPAPLGSAANAKLKPYRDYQIASANFYAGNFDQAKADFEKIAQDPASPFRSLGTYLAIRSEVRKALLTEKTDNALLASAEKQAKAMLSDKSQSSLHAALQDLLAFVRFKLEPKERFGELAKILVTSGEGKNLSDNLGDFTMLFDNLTGDSDGGPNVTDAEKIVNREFIRNSGELGDWLLTFQAKDGKPADATKHAIDKWKQTHKAPWLVAALSLVDSKNPDCAKLLDDARAVAKNSPAYLDLQYHILRLSGSANKEQARQKCEELMADKSLDMGPSARNELTNLRLAFSKDFTDFCRFALQRPASIDSGYLVEEIPNDYKVMESASTYKLFPPTFSYSTANFFNALVPLNSLLSLKDNANIPKPLKADVLQALWTRAFLLKDDKAMAAVSPSLKQAMPALSPMLAAYEKAGSPEEKNFAGAFMLLSNPGMRPIITGGQLRQTEFNHIDDYQDNWWQKENFAVQKKGTEYDPVKDQDAQSYAACLSKTDATTGAAEVKKLTALGPAPAVMCDAILAYARKAPQDQRVPQALALAVKATHFGESGPASKKGSKECFTLLHSKYPKNPWTVKTPYYY